MAGENTIPKVFFSYSWGRPEHEDWVLKLGTDLRNDRVEVIMDKWHLKPGHDKYKFMEQMVHDPTIERVLCICDRSYAEKANNRSGGVGTEAQIITPELYSTTQQEKFVPIIAERDEQGNPFLPTFMKAFLYIDLSNPETFEDEYKKLVLHINNRPLFVPPPIGPAPVYITRQDIPPSRTYAKFRRFKDAVENDKKTVRALTLEYCSAVLTALKDLIIPDGAEGDQDELVLQAVDSFLPTRDEFCEFVRTLCRFIDGAEMVTTIHDFFERSFEVRYRSDDDYYSMSAWRTDAVGFVLRDIFLHSIAIMIQERKFAEVDELLSRPYHTYLREELREFNYGNIDAHGRSLEEFRNSRFSPKRISVTADEVKRRASVADVPFSNLVQAELVLFLRGVIGDKGARWNPCLSVYISKAPHSFRIFAEGVEPNRCRNLLKLLSVKSTDELLERYQRARSGSLFQSITSHYHLHFLEDYLRLEKLAKV